MTPPRRRGRAACLTVVAMLILGHATPAWADAASNSPRPNVLWITLEDISPSLGCYGDPDARTPRMDALAAEGIRYTRASSNAGMCATARATLITGMYPPSLGTQHMRSRVHLPDSIRAFPEFLRRAGYFCSNHAKTDYNWDAPESTWDIQDVDWSERSWRRRAADQPFFTVINIGDTHSSQIYHRGEAKWKRRVAALGEERTHAPESVAVPPYYPDVPAVRQDLARYHDNISYADRIVGNILDQLEADGLADDTIVFLFSDHGMGMPRAKGFCFESSLRVPLIIRFPQPLTNLSPGRPGTATDRLVSFVDFAPTVLSLCGLSPPPAMHGRAFLGKHPAPIREHQFCYRDRMDERYELIRGVSDGRHKLIRNFYPHLPWFHEQTRLYPSSQPTYRVWHRMAAQGRLSGPPAVYMAKRKPPVQLFDLEADPHELNNLADSPAWAAIRDRLDGVLTHWMLKYRDLGFLPEAQWTTRFGDRGDPVSIHTIVRARPDAYPLTRILPLAKTVGGGPMEIERQVATASDSNATVRYWAALGLLAQPDLASDGAAGDALREMLGDQDAACRIAAAEAVVHHGVGSTDKAIAELVTEARRGDAATRWLAINALDRLKDRVEPAAAETLRFLLAETPSDWIDRSVQATVWSLLNPSK